MKSLILKRSKIEVQYNPDFSIRDLSRAQMAAGKDSFRLALFLAQSNATFNGEKWTVAKIEEKLSGKDYLQLSTALLSDDEDDVEDEGKLEAGEPA